MKQITVNVPEEKFKFFIELISSLGFTKAATTEDATDFTVPEFHKKIVRERIKNFKKNPKKAFSQKEVDKRIKFD